MENNDGMTTQSLTPNVSVFKNALTYGLYTGIAYILVSLLFYALDLDKNTWLNSLTYIILILGIIFATLNYRNKLNGGYITYGKAVLTGFYMSLIVGIIMAVYTWLFYSFINPNGLKELLDLTEQKMAETGLSDEMIDQQMKMTSKFMEMPLLNLLTFAGLTFWGTIISLITSAFLKKQDDSFNTTFNQ